MANTKKAETQAVETQAVDSTNDSVNDTVKVTEQSEQKAEKKKKFNPTDMIPCVSITAGEMFYIGSKSQTLYIFANIDDVVGIEFRDLDYAARSKNKMMFKPRFIVQDNDFIALHPILNEIYSSLHTAKDLKDILKMPPSQMEKTINSLPEGAKDAIKTIAATMVDNGTLDSIQRVKVLDAIFGTEMFLKLTSE